MLSFRRATVLEAPDSVRRVAETGMVGRRDQANRATVPPAHIAMFTRLTRLTRLTRMEAKTRQARSERWSWPAREPRPNPLDTRRPIQGLLRLHSRALERERRAAREACIGASSAKTTRDEPPSPDRWLIRRWSWVEWRQGSFPTAPGSRWSRRGN